LDRAVAVWTLISGRDRAPTGPSGREPIGEAVKARPSNAQVQALSSRHGCRRLALSWSRRWTSEDREQG